MYEPSRSSRFSGADKMIIGGISGNRTLPAQPTIFLEIYDVKGYVLFRAPVLVLFFVCLFYAIDRSFVNQTNPSRVALEPTLPGPMLPSTTRLTWGSRLRTRERSTTGT